MAEQGIREQIAREICRQSATSLYSHWYENEANSKENETWFRRADQILSLTISRGGGKCPKGEDGLQGSWDEDKHKIVRVWCPNCKGTGSLPIETKTVNEILEEWKNENSKV